MPDNAHSSYVEAAIPHARKIIADPLSRAYSAKFAAQVCKRYDRKPYDENAKALVKLKTLWIVAFLGVRIWFSERYYRAKEIWRNKKMCPHCVMLALVAIVGFLCSIFNKDSWIRIKFDTWKAKVIGGHIETCENDECHHEHEDEDEWDEDEDEDFQYDLDVPPDLEEEDEDKTDEEASG